MTRRLKKIVCRELLSDETLTILSEQSRTSGKTLESLVVRSGLLRLALEVRDLYIATRAVKDTGLRNSASLVLAEKYVSCRTLVRMPDGTIAEEVRVPSFDELMTAVKQNGLQSANVDYHEIVSVKGSSEWAYEVVADRYNITSRALRRWLSDADLNKWISAPTRHIG